MLGDLLALGTGLMSDNRQRALTREQMRMADSQFRAQMDQSIQRRVADARKAGIHPLFALGASVGVSPTFSAGGGRVGGRAAQAANNLATNLARAQIAKTEAEAQLAASEAARVRQDMSSQGRDMPKDIPETASVQNKALAEKGLIEIVPPQIPAREAVGRQAGTAPMWRTMQLESGAKIRVPSEEAMLDEAGQVTTVGQMALHQMARAITPYYVNDKSFARAWNRLWKFTPPPIREIKVVPKNRRRRAWIIRRPSWVPVKVWRAAGQALGI